LEQQRSIERERTRIAQDLHDDLGASLTEISMLAAASGHKPAGAAANGDPLTEIAHRSNNLVRAMDEIVWAVNPRHDSVVSLAEYLSAYARDFLETAGIRARLDVQRGLPSLPLKPDQRHELFHAVKEAIRNAARHSQATEVWLRIQVANRRLIVRVEDDGRGIDASSAEGNGLHNMRERLTRLGGSFQIRNGGAKGTTVELNVPLA
jgi:signal transduction histidine kinase